LLSLQLNIIKKFPSFLVHPQVVDELKRHVLFIFLEKICFSPKGSLRTPKEPFFSKKKSC